MDVSVIVVNYNTKDITKKCIDSIFNYTKDLECEVILVDNASTDGSIAEFESDSRIKFIRNSINVGFGKANNIGYRNAIGKYLFLLNSDTLLLNDALSQFVNTISKLDNPGCVGCVLKSEQNTVVNSYGIFPTMRSELKSRGLLHYFLAKKKKYKNVDFSGQPYKEVDYVIGADIFMKKEKNEFNLFDEDFFLYYEETEMQYRYKKNGLRNYIIDGPEIIHLGGESGFKKFSLKKGAIILRSSFLYIKKTSSAVEYYMYRILAVFLNLPFFFRPSYTVEEKKNYFHVLLGKL